MDTVKDLVVLEYGINKFMKLNIITPIYYGGDHRIDYFKRYINHINKIYNLQNCNFIFLIEPDSEKMLDLIPDHWNKTFLINYYRFGPILNHYIGFKYCFDTLKSEFSILLEDDIIVSPDIYNLIQYCLSTNILDENVLCLLNKHSQFNPSHKLYQKNSKELLIQINDVKYLSGWGFGISKKFWENVLKNIWSMTISFDSNLDLNFKKCGVVTPVVSRANQIGEIGFNYTKSQWDSHGFADIQIENNYNDNLYRIEKVD